MEQNKGKRRTLTTIIVSTSIVVFSLFVTTLGSYAWFETTRKFSATAGQFRVDANTMDIKLKSVVLYKFVYPIEGNGKYDYLDPMGGEVRSYPYVSDEGQFGEYVDTVETTIDENSSVIEISTTAWDPTDVMNLYDPVEQEILKSTLLSMNCNAVFAVTFQCSDVTSADLTVSAIRNDERAAAASSLYTSNEYVSTILLSSCADFDAFTEGDLASSNSAFTSGNNSQMYWPVFDTGYSFDMTGEAAQLYFKISYLSSLMDGNHAHLYTGSGTTRDHVTIRSLPGVDLSSGTYTIYVNVNYSPSELLKYSRSISNGTIRAVFDYDFRFSFE